MGGEGSGRRPDVTKKVLSELATKVPYLNPVSNAMVLPNLSGVKHEIQAGTHNITIADIPGYVAPVTAHASLTQLDYASAGHTGFQPAGSYLTAETDPIYSANTYAVAMNQNVATTSSPTFANLSIGNAGNLIMINTSGTNRGVSFYSASAIDNIANMSAFPSSGTNVKTSFYVIPKGSGLSSQMADLVVFNTNYVADATNYEALFLRANTTDFRIFTFKNGTGTLRPLYFDATGAETYPQFYLLTTGTCVIGHSSETGITRLNQPAAIVTAGQSVYGGLSLADFSAGTGYPILDLCRSKSNTKGTHTVVASGETCGAIVFRGSDGDEFHNVAYIAGACDGTPGNNDMPGRLVFFTTADGGTGGTERMRIKSTGVINIASIPTSSAGLSTGDLWCDTTGGLNIIKIV